MLTLKLNHSRTFSKGSAFSLVPSGVAKEENALLGSPISRLARLWFESLGFASVGTGFPSLCHGVVSEPPKIRVRATARKNLHYSTVGSDNQLFRPGGTARK